LAFLPQVALRPSSRVFPYATLFRSQVVRHRIDVVGQVLPRSGHAFDTGLAAELPFGAHLAGDARDLVREGRELVDHRVDRVLEGERKGTRLNRSLLPKAAARVRLRN